MHTGSRLRSGFRLFFACRSRQSVSVFRRNAPTFCFTQFRMQNRYTLLLELLYRWAEQGMDS
jgi:hypothetical protein